MENYVRKDAFLFISYIKRIQDFLRLKVHRITLMDVAKLDAIHHSSQIPLMIGCINKPAVTIGCICFSINL